jgi:tubulin--tyrosine ligase-like protein 12
MAQLRAIGFPENLWSELYLKLKQSVFDAGTMFQYGITEDQKRTPYSLFAIEDIKSNSEVFLIDHIWTTTSDRIFPQLVENEKLRNMCYQLMNIEPISENVKYENQVSSEAILDQTSDISIDATYPSGYFLHLADSNFYLFPSLKLTDYQRKSIVALNIRNNNITSLSDVVNIIGTDLCSQIKALYLQNNPVIDSITVDDVMKLFPNLELYNSQFTERYTEWVILFLEDLSDPKEARALDLSGRNLSLWKPDIFAKFSNCNVMNIRNMQFGPDFTEFFNTIYRMPCLSEILVDYPVQLAMNTHIADAKDKLHHLQKINGWRFRIGLPTIDELNATQIYQKAFQYLDAYQFTTMYTPNWYLMDQLGISINHSDLPNVMVAPFYFIDSQQSFSILWPIKDIAANEEITRDFLYGVQPEEKRKLLMSVWGEIPQISIPQISIPHSASPPSIYGIAVPFDDTIRKKEMQKVFKYYTDSKMVIKSLSLQKEDDSVLFRLVEDKEEADILFIVHEHIKQYDDMMSRKQFVNQFEKEDNYTMKGKFARAIHPFKLSFIPETYDLTDLNQIGEFLLAWKSRKEKNEDNIWIVKPWNLSRSMDMVISDEYSTCLKVSLLVPKICSKYISNACLLNGKKFDFRFLIMVKPINESEISVAVHNTYYVRVSNHDYSLDNFHDFQKHFTVMNYYEDVATGERCYVNRISQKESLEQFEKKHGPWEPVKKKIFDSFKELFTCLKSYILVDEKSCFQRSVYGIDVMLDNNLEPKILEINYSPDAARLVDYGECPTFYIDVFKFLFTNNIPSNITKLF